MNFQASPLSRPIFTGSLVLAPLLVLLSAIAIIAEGEGDNHGEAGGIIQVWGFVVFALVIVRLTGLLSTAAPTVALILLVTGCIGVAGGVGYGIDAVQADVFDNDSIQDTSSVAAPLALQLLGICFPLTLLAIAIMLARTSAAPLPAALLLGAGAILFPLGNIPNIQSLTVVANSVLVAAGIALALTLDQSPAEHGRIATPDASAAG